MKTFSTCVHPKFVIGKTDPRLFGSFVEHMGSVVTNGIFQPGHPQSNEKGWRTDVLSLLQKLNLSVLRYPGGNYTSSYCWEDTVGPDRLPTLNLPWREMEPNEFGLHEFMDWKKNFSAEAMMTVNLGTRGAKEAAELLEYCNFPAGTKFSEKRRANGAPDPFNIRMWCLGNELDGVWQMGHKTAKEYGRLACVTGQLMHQLDRSLQLACVGSSATHLENYPEWNRKVLMQCFDEVDFITLHKYISKQGLETQDYLCMPADMNQMIDTVVRACDYVAACKRSSRKINISFDEWNVGPVVADGDLGEWPVGPMRDCISFTMEDVLVFAGMFLALLNHADRVKVACQALIVNDLGLVLADDRGAYPNGTYSVFKLLSDHARGTVLARRNTGDTVETLKFGDQPVLDTLVVRKDDGTIRAFAVNRSSDPVQWEVDCPGLIREPADPQAWHIHAPLDARNSLEVPDRITAEKTESPTWRNGILSGNVEPYSLTMWSA